VTLTLHPTSRLEGKVELHGQPASSVGIAVRDTQQPATVNYGVYTGLRPDGSFVLDGVPRGTVLVQTGLLRGATTQVITGIEVAVDRPVIKGITLELRSSKRVVHVIVRSLYGGVGVPAAQVVVLPGRVPSSNMLAIKESLRTAAVRFGTPILGEQAPKPVLEKAKLGDLFATVSEVPEGEASACAIGLPRNLDPDTGKKLQNPANMARVAVPCVPIGPTDEVVVVEVPPWPRLD
jgi:hypothetical protein